MKGRMRVVMLGAVLLGAVLGALAAGAATAEAQVLDRLKRQAGQKVERKVERGVDRAVDAAADAVTCLITDRECREKAEKAGKPVVLTDASGKRVNAPAADARGSSGAPGTPGAAAVAGAGQVPGEGAWANYDFIPGERVLYADDFTADVVGDFPRRLEFVDGTAELVEWEGRRFLRATSPSRFAVALPAALPERFTIEFDVHTPRPQHGVSVVTGAMPARFAAYKHQYANVGHWRGSGVWAASAPVASLDDKRPGGQIVRARVMADGPYVKVFVNERRVANVPRADLPRTNKIHFVLDARPSSPVYVTDIRIAAGGRALYDALAADGRVATQGILFDTGRDVIRPESTPTLREIGAMLTEHADLTLTIEGHTDNVGNAAANRTLSEQRAAAVKAYLVARHGIAADRLRTAGFGDTRPAAPNATAEGRQQNRRVELVKGS